MASSTAPSWAKWRLNPPTAIPLSTSDNLPHLPVPELSQTADKLLNSARALAKSEEELAALQRKLEEFARAGGVGEELQKRLKERANDSTLPSWIAEWWDEQAYMAYRASVVLNVSYYYGFLRLPQSDSTTASQEQSNPIFVASTLVQTILDFRQLLLDGKIEPDTAGGAKLCMESYKWMFNACRIPSKPSDYAIKLREDDPAGSHFIVIRNNKIWKLPLLDERGQAWSRKSLESAFTAIYNDKEKVEPVGLLTGADRDLWTDARAHLLTISKTNVETLSAIEAASFVVCLDPAKPSSAIDLDAKTTADQFGNAVQFSRELFHGDGQNRWYDKPLQWVVFDSGECGFIGEHSCMDGTPTAKVNDYIGHRLLNRQFTKGGSEASLTPKHLTIQTDATAKSHLERAGKEYADAVAEQDLGYLHYARYGKEGIKKQKASPDGWVQMVMQLAHALTFPSNPVVGTYEAAMTRRFNLGRTETVRIASPQTKAFTMAMLPNSTVKDSKRKRELFLEALKQHGKDMKDASNAMGCDRHLFGLKMLASQDESMSGKVELFKDELLARSGTWQMSTSAIYSKSFRAYGWGQVVPDGFGLPYSIHDNHLVFTVTSKKSQKNKEFVENLKIAADMLMDMSEQAMSEQAKL